MRYQAIAFDYDGTIASSGVVADDTRRALERLVESGRRLVLVTGRELDDLQRVFDRLDLFERVVAENGALIYRPSSREERLLCEGPPPDFVEELRRRGVDPLSSGRAIVATWSPNENVVLQAIHDLGLELHVIFNKGAVMVLPSGVNKASGLAAALEEMKLSPHNVAGIGDAENDHAFLAMCEAMVVTANAVESLRRAADWITEHRNGGGVIDMADRVLGDDLAGVADARHAVVIGEDEDVRIPPYGSNVLLAGPSGSGKTTITTAFMETLIERGYQSCVVDPEGDYETLEGAISLGTPDRAPTVDEVIRLLDSPSSNAVVNLLGVSLEDRPGFFETLLPRLLEMRARTGRPHWIVVDEVHHLLPVGREPRAFSVPQDLRNVFAITVHPDSVRADLLARVGIVIATQPTAVEAFAGSAGLEAPRCPEPRDREALVWRIGDEPVAFRRREPAGERKRHARKYAQGDLNDMAFWFRGPEGKLRLRAQNLSMFVQIASGVDPETWTYHLRRGDIKSWLRFAVKDDALVAAAERAERASDAKESLAIVRDAIEARYTAPE